LFPIAKPCVSLDQNQLLTSFYLRAQLLTTPIRGEVQSLLRHYVDLRVHAGAVALDHEEKRM